jgi:glucose-1-phosphate adenylyltransferase
MPGSADTSLASMGIYIFDAKYLYALLEENSRRVNTAHDFGRDLIPEVVARGDAIAHPFSLSCAGQVPDSPPYWRDVGTVDAYWEANIDLCATTPALNLYDKDWPIFTYQEQTPPAKFVHNAEERRGSAMESMVSGGCIVSGRIIGSLLFSNVRTHSFSRVEKAVLLPDVIVSRGARLTKCVIDRGCFIPENMVIGEDETADRTRFYRSEKGVTLVTQTMLDQLAARPA